MQIGRDNRRERGQHPAALRREPRFCAERPVGALLARERRSLQIRTPSLTPDIAFLRRRGVPDAILANAACLAAIRGTEARQELIAAGFSSRRYWEMLAEELGLPFLTDLAGAEILNNPRLVTIEAVRSAASLLVRIEGRTLLLRAPGRDEVELLRSRLRDAPELAERVRICPPESIRALLVAHRRAALSHYAVNRLQRVLPSLSAARLGAGRGAQASVNLVCALFGLCLADPFNLGALVLLLCTLFFTNCALWKLAAAVARPKPLRLEPVRREALPTYSVLVPLHHEAPVVPDLIRRLAALDYPALCIKRTKRRER